MNNDNCQLCKLNQQSPLFLDETSTLMLFINARQNPEGKGKPALMAITKEHKSNFFDLTAQEWSEIRELFLKWGLRDSPFHILTNSGTLAGQTQPHFHIHFFAREEGDGFENMVRTLAVWITDDESGQKRIADIKIHLNDVKLKNQKNEKSKIKKMSASA